MSYKFSVGDRIRHFDNGALGTIVGLTTLHSVVDGDCAPEEADQPWYLISWDAWDPEDLGQEAEGSLEALM